MVKSSPSSQPLRKTVAELIAAARSHGLELTSNKTEFDRTGLDFLALHDTDARGVAWIVRTPRRPEVISASRVEANVLALVGPRLPASVPSFRVHADDVIAYPRVEGTPAVTFDVLGPSWNVIDPTAPPEIFLDSCATTYAALMNIHVEEARRAGVPIKTIRDARIEVGYAMEITRRELSPPDSLWRRWQRWLGDDDAWPREVSFVHGDLHPGHMLLDADGKLVGVLDWTEAQVSDPSVDLAMFYGCFGAAALDEILARIEKSGVVLWPGLAAHAKERWSVFPTLFAEWALRTGNDAALTRARAKLRAQLGS